MDQEPQPERRKNLLTKALSKVFMGAVGLFFFFGDKALREIWHFSFGASMMIWAGVLAVILISLVVVSHFRDQ